LVEKYPYNQVTRGTLGNNPSRQEAGMAGSQHISRRDFVKLTTMAVGGFIGAAIGLPAIAYLIDPALKTTQSDAWIPLGQMENFQVDLPTPVNFTRSKTNGWEKTVNSYGMFVIKKSDSEAVVLSNKCTHLGCRVNWQTETQEFVCPCHDARFGAGGQVLGGPPPRPLDQYAGDQLKIEDGILYLHFVEG
jgi:menaquinol-cytochrome c reductase iron-sulfur subunit